MFPLSCGTAEMEAALKLYQTTWHHIPESGIFHYTVLLKSVQQFLKLKCTAETSPLRVHCLHFVERMLTSNYLWKLFSWFFQNVWGIGNISVLLASSFSWLIRGSLMWGEVSLKLPSTLILLSLSRKSTVGLLRSKTVGSLIFEISKQCCFFFSLSLSLSLSP
jgi:hypothetical protein